MLHSLMFLPPNRLHRSSFSLISPTSSLYHIIANTLADQLAVNSVRAILEQELDKRRQFQAGGIGVESLCGGEGNNTEDSLLGCGGVFSFSGLEGGEVAFLSTPVPRTRDGIQDEKSRSINGLESLQQRLTTCTELSHNNHRSYWKQ